MGGGSGCLFTGSELVDERERGRWRQRGRQRETFKHIFNHQKKIISHFGCCWCFFAWYTVLNNQNSFFLLDQSMCLFKFK